MWFRKPAFDNYRSADRPGNTPGKLKILRINNLDTLRAGAILMVLVYHSTQLFANQWPRVWQFTQAGFFGVDLFFALSGYLIGSLFFLEQVKNGRVHVARFILRRISRTVPPYMIVLAFAYLAVYIYRDQPFDFGYLVFAQNYYIEIPFFLISWSLCVEEHFYLLLPLLLTVLFKLFNTPRLLFAALLFTMSLIPLLFRLSHQEVDPKPFGFYQTATHLRFDPLILGVMYAYISIYYKYVIIKLLNYKYVIYLSAAFLLLSYNWWPEQWIYSAGVYIVGFSFATAVAVSCEDRCWSLSKIELVAVIAKISYAIYLTHVLSIHLLEKIFAALDIDFIVLQFCVILLTTTCVGYFFYRVIEQPIMSWRSQAIPSYRRIDQETSYADTRH